MDLSLRNDLCIRKEIIMYRVSEAKQKLYEERQNYINIDSFPTDLTIISNTCIGGRLYHDYHQKF